MDLVQVCKPDDKCEGYLPATKQGSGYCPGQPNDSCMDHECPTDKG